MLLSGTGVRVNGYDIEKFGSGGLRSNYRQFLAAEEYVDSYDSRKGLFTAATASKPKKTPPMFIPNSR